MGRVLCMVLCGSLAVGCLIGGVCAADDECKSSAKAQVSGKIVIIGPDGKKQEFDFGKAISEKMQKQIQVQVQSSTKSGGKEPAKGKWSRSGKIMIIGPGGKKQEFDLGPGKEEKGGGQSFGVQVQLIDGKLTVVGPDGKKQEIDLGAAKKGECPKAKGKKQPPAKAQISGKAIIIGPDGRRQEFDLGGGSLKDLDLDLDFDLDLEGLLPKDIHEQIQKALKGHMADLPKPAAASQRNLERQIKQLQQQNKRLAEQLKKLQKDIEALKSK